MGVSNKTSIKTIYNPSILYLPNHMGIYYGIPTLPQAVLLQDQEEPTSPSFVPWVLSLQRPEIGSCRASIFLCVLAMCVSLWKPTAISLVWLCQGLNQEEQCWHFMSAHIDPSLMCRHSADTNFIRSKWAWISSFGAPICHFADVCNIISPCQWDQTGFQTKSNKKYTHENMLLVVLL